MADLTPTQVIDLNKDTTPTEGDLFLAQGQDGSKAIDFGDILDTIRERIAIWQYALSTGDTPLPTAINQLIDAIQTLQRTQPALQTYLETEVQRLEDYVLALGLDTGEPSQDAQALIENLQLLLSEIDGGSFETWYDSSKSVIRARRGLEENFVEEALLPGEFAVSTDEGKVRVGIRSGYAKELAGKEEAVAAASEAAEAWATGKRGGVNVSSSDPAYHNNAKYYSEQAAATLSSKADSVSIAPAYSDSGTYAVNDLCTHEGKLYKCNTPITTAEAWTARHWTVETIDGEIYDLKDSYTHIGTVNTITIPNWLIGGMHSGMEASGNYTNRCRIVRTEMPIVPNDHLVYVKVSTGYEVRIAVYNTIEFNSRIATITSGFYAGDVIIPDQYVGKYVEVDARKTNQEDFTEQEAANLSDYISLCHISAIGKIDDLNTTTKASLVEAINEVNSIATIASDTASGAASTLQTVDDELIDLKDSYTHIGTVNTITIPNWVIGGMHSGMEASGNYTNRCRILRTEMPIVPNNYLVYVNVASGYKVRVAVYNTIEFGSRIETITSGFSTEDVVIPNQYIGKYVEIDVQKTSGEDFTEQEAADLSNYISLCHVSAVGKIDDLNTTTKVSLVEAINEVNAGSSSAQSDVADIKELLVTNAYNGSEAVNRLYLNGTTGKIVSGATTTPRTVIFSILPNTKYTISFNSIVSTKRIGTFQSYPVVDDIPTVFIQSDTGEPIEIISGVSDYYMAIQLFKDGDSETDINAFYPVLSVSYLLRGDDLVTNGELNDKLDSKINAKIDDAITIIPSPFRHKMFHDHLLIDKTSGNNVIIPSESIPYIQMSRRLGYENCELNIHATSDNQYIVGHGSSNNFGTAFEHTDGTTNISSVPFSSVTMDWIKTYVRFKSLYPKYRVAPPTLEEALYECRVNHLIPFVTAGDAQIVRIVENIMGKNNYIAYNGSRDLTSGIIYKYGTYSNINDIKTDIDAYGPPFIYGISSPENFSDADIVEILNYAHQKGCMIGFSAYANMAQQQRLIGLGVDFAGTRFAVNDFESGNLCNLAGDLDFSDFTTTGTINSDYNLFLTNGGTLSPSSSLPSCFLSKGSLHIRYNGSLKFTMGDYISDTTISSDGEKTVWLSTYFMEQSPTFRIVANDDTTIYNLTYKASKA